MLPTGGSGLGPWLSSFLIQMPSLEEMVTSDQMFIGPIFIFLRK